MLASLATDASRTTVAALRALLEGLEPEARIALCAHTRPDGDAIGSVAALASALRAAGHSVAPLLADNSPVPQAYRWMPQAAEFVSVHKLEKALEFDLFIALDTPELARLGQAGRFCCQARRRVLIDHHPAYNPYTELAVVATDAAATGQLIWELLPELGLVRFAEVAAACYVALVSDTGRFSFSNTDACALSDASAMVAAGADPAAIARALFGRKPLAALKLDELILSRLRIENGGAVVASQYCGEDMRRLGVSSDWSENLIDLIRVVEGTQVAVLVVEGAQGGRASLRSSGDFDVSVVARRFGGGGHQAAAGITWPDKAAGAADILAALLPLLPGGDAA
ncbi:MAG: DHH family phosphoesterase [Actinomycetia bacterium]|nr:DHH family phosphoesterase [Actinomycetes bacterium]